MYSNIAKKLLTLVLVVAVAAMYGCSCDPYYYSWTKEQWDAASDDEKEKIALAIRDEWGEAAKHAGDTSCSVAGCNQCIENCNTGVNISATSTKEIRSMISAAFSRGSDELTLGQIVQSITPR